MHARMLACCDLFACVTYMSLQEGLFSSPVCTQHACKHVSTLQGLRYFRL